MPVVLIAIPVGLLIGLSLGALGGGGSILTVPALVYLLDQSPHAATTGSLIIVGITAVTGMAAHLRAGRVRLAQGLTFGLLGIAGSYLGTRLSTHVDANVLLTAFSVLMIVAAGAMYRRSRVRPTSGPHQAPDTGSSAPAPVSGSSGGASGAHPVGVLEPDVATRSCRLPAVSSRVDTCLAIRVLLAATVVGLLTGFFGVGGGFVIVPALVLALRFPMQAAVGTSLLVIAINAAAALVARLGTHVVLDWPLLATFIASAIVGSFAGNRVASRVDAGKLTVAFSVLLTAVAIYTAARSIPHVV